jgi:ureidoglycolate lyase
MVEDIQSNNLACISIGKMGLFADTSCASQVIDTEVLCQQSFAEFGTVIENPAPSLIPSLDIRSLPKNAVQANQGSALKYLDVTHMVDLYGSAPSHEPAKAVMNMFVCAPRPLLPCQHVGTADHFPVKILERHPFTTQTFIPLGLSASEPQKARYLVVVAPSLSPSTADDGLPVPTPTETSGPLPGRGLPDLNNVRAFVANGAQAVTYAAGTWHAPMVVIGRSPIDFVVVQFANGVGIEDCQERELDVEVREEILVVVAKSEVSPRRWWKL